MTMVPVKMRKRASWVQICVYVLVAVIVARLLYLQVFNRGWYMSLASKQWNNTERIPAARGRILDRNGEILAEDGSSVSVVVRPGEVTAADLLADRLSEILSLDRTSVYEKATNTKLNTIILKRHITDAQEDKIRALKLSGVSFQQDTKRYYPQKGLLSRVIGFTDVDSNGIDGLEKKYNDALSGIDGIKQYQRDAQSRESPYSVPVVLQEAQDGNSIVLTVDYAIQSIAEKIAAEAQSSNNAKSATVMVMDPDTSEILALAISPSIEDMNNLPRNDAELFQSLIKNTAISDVYDPGSTFKIITTAAALEEKIATPERGFYDNGYIEVSGVKLKCWRSYNPHGQETLQEALKNSCNPVFVTLGTEMGTETFYKYLSAFGLTKKTGVDLIGESAGGVMKIKYAKELDLACMSFGQSLPVTALQLVNAVCAAVNGGRLMQPYIVKKTVDADGNTVSETEPVVLGRAVSEETSRTMREMLEKVVSDGIKSAVVEGYSVGGKTGTAQKVVDGAVSQTAHISSFVGFAPADKPEFVVYIAVDEPSIGVNYGSVVAAPYAKQLMQEILQYMQIPPSAEGGQHGLGEQKPVPDVSGMTVAEAMAVLQSAGFESLSNGNSGKVLSQTPAANAMLETGGTVLLEAEAAEGDSAIISMPSLAGLTKAEAVAKLAELGLIADTSGSGRVVWQSVQEGVSVEEGSVIRIKLEEVLTD